MDSLAGRGQGHGERLAGLLVDEVSDIVTVVPEDTQPTQDLASTPEDGFVWA